MTNQNYVNKQMIQYIESFTVEGESVLNTFPKMLPNGRSLSILKCMTCKGYNYKTSSKVNQTDKPFFKWVSMYQCNRKDCNNFND
jgi:hypothetical protein